MHRSSLRAGIESIKCKQLDASTWQISAAIVGHDCNRIEAEPCIKVYGMVRLLFPVQLHVTIRTLFQTHSIVRHVFNACHMGLGKGTMMFTVPMIQHIMNLFWDHIDNHPDMHWDTSMPKKATCPSHTELKQRWGYDCPCAPSSPTHPIKANFGVPVIICPLGLLANVVNEYRKCFGIWDDNTKQWNFTNQSNPFGFRLALCHSLGSATDNTALTPEVINIMKSEIVESEDAAPDAIPQLYPRVENSKVFVVTTSGSFTSQVLSKFRRQKVWMQPQPDKIVQAWRGKPARKEPQLPRRMTKDWFPLILNFFERDECHQERLQTSETIKELNGSFLASEQNCDMRIIGLSGTPMEMGPADIAWFVERMKYFETENWKQHPVLKNWLNGEAIKLAERWEKAIKKRDFKSPEFHTIVEELIPIVETLFIRFVPKSSFLTVPQVLNIAPNFHQDLGCEHPAEGALMLAEHEARNLDIYEEKKQRMLARHLSKGKSEDSFIPPAPPRPSMRYQDRLIVSFPELSRIRDAQGEELKLTEQEWKNRTTGDDADWLNGQDPYTLNMDQIVKSSGKLAVIKSLINQYKDELSEKDGKRRRMIFCSYFFVGAWIVYLVTCTTLNYQK